jgi:hypothetical protein
MSNMPFAGYWKINLEIHHIKSLKNVRVKTRTYAQWIGGFYRKSIPLRKEHHLQLSREDVNILSMYKGKIYDYDSNEKKIK